MRSWKAVTLTTAAKGYWVIGAMLSTVITARFLGPHGRGIIAAATSWVAMFVTFGHLSLAHVLVYVLAPRERERIFPAVTGSVLVITAAITLLGWTIAAAMQVLSRGRAFGHIPLAVLVVAFAGLPLLLWMENGNSLLIVLGDLKRLSMAQIAGTTTAIVLVAFAVGVAKGGVTAALAATLVSYLVVTGLGLSRILRDARPLTFSPAIAGRLLSGGARLHLSAVGTVFFNHAGVILLNQFRPVAEAGYFQLAMQLTTATQVVPMAVAIVAYSIVSRDGADAGWPEHRRLIVQTMLYATVAAAGSYFLAPCIVPLLAGPGFEPAVSLFRILTLSVFGMSLGVVMAPQWVARGYFLQVTLLVMVPAVIAVVGNILLVPKYGMAAAAWMMVASYSIHMLGNVAFIWWIEVRAK